MAKFGIVPPEVPVERRLSVCAPKFAQAVGAMLEDPRVKGGREEWPFETLRTEERQSYLYKFGRDYDDGRGIVTYARTALYGWHAYGLAVDVVEKDSTPWDAPPDFWLSICLAAEAHGLTSGYRWKGKKQDRPHVQWGACPATPTDADRALFAAEGMQAVWAKYGAA